MLIRIKQVTLGVIALFGVLIVSGIAFEQWSRWSISREFKPVGQLFEVDGIMMHLNCTGDGAPTVVLESGWGDEGSRSWSEVQPEIAKTNRVCSYDRAGILWSEGLHEPVTAVGTVTRLHSLLGIAAETPPYVMVGHSLGGRLIMAFAEQHPRDVVGAVLVDSSHPDQHNRYPAEFAKVDEIQGLDRAVYIFKAKTGLMRLSQPDPYDGISYIELAAIKYLPQTIPGIFAEMDAFDQMFAGFDLAAVFGDLPLIVLTATKFPKGQLPEITPEQWARFEKAKAEMQIELAAMSTIGEQRVIADAPHYVHYQNPEAVILAIRDVLAATQEPDGRN